MYLSSDKIRKYHFEKSFDILKDMVKWRSPVSLLNTSLLDGDEDGKNELIQGMDRKGLSYNIINVADKIKNKSSMRIVYLLYENKMDSGAKTLLEQANVLSERGHDILIYAHHREPEWIKCKGRYFLVHPDNLLSDIVPEADVVIAGSLDAVPCAMKVKAPVKYLFVHWDYEMLEKFVVLSNEKKDVLYAAYTLPIRIITVSTTMKGIIKDGIGRKCSILRDGINTEIFCTKKRVLKANNPLEILICVNSRYTVEEHNKITKALYYLENRGYKFNIRIIAMSELQKEYCFLNSKTSCYIAPSQKEIADICRSSDVFICGSFYEAMVVNPLEAMACGTATVIWDNEDIWEYAIDRENSLIFSPNSTKQLTEKLEELFCDGELLGTIRRNGMLTAKNHSWKKSVKTLEQELISSAICTMQATT